jgi:hypothetical protein
MIREAAISSIARVTFLMVDTEDRRWRSSLKLAGTVLSVPLAHRAERGGVVALRERRSVFAHRSSARRGAVPDAHGTNPSSA